MKPGKPAWVRVGLARIPVLGILKSIDLATGTGEVQLRRRTVTRDLKRIYAKRPPSASDTRR